jgi:hypothetical protein
LREVKDPDQRGDEQAEADTRDEAIQLRTLRHVSGVDDPSRLEGDEDEDREPRRPLPVAPSEAEIRPRDEETSQEDRYEHDNPQGLGHALPRVFLSFRSTGPDPGKDDTEGDGLAAISRGLDPDGDGGLSGEFPFPRPAAVGIGRG